jgi:hypothetical protein
VVDLTFGKPYWEDALIREFDPSRDDAEFVWHRDAEDREIEIVAGEGWQFQLQNCLPWLLTEGMVFDVKKEEYHRLIKGVTPLKCKVFKNGDSSRTKG